ALSIWSYGEPFDARSFANAGHDVSFEQERAVDGTVEPRIGGVPGVEGLRERASLRQGADEGVAAWRKAPDFHLEERPCHEGAFGAPSLDPATCVIAFVDFPNRHDGETRCEEENRWMQCEAQHLGPFRSQERLKKLLADPHGSHGVAGFALRHLELGDIRDVFNRRSVALASEKAREHLPVLQPGHNGRSFAHDESMSHRNERLMPDHAPGNGKTLRQAVGEAAIGFQNVVCPTSFCPKSPRRYTRSEAHSRKQRLAIRGGGHGSLLG